MRKAAIILPTYNEAQTITSLIDGLSAEIKHISNWQIYILVVDSSSPDRTAEVVEKAMKNYPHLHILKTKKEGLGKAYIQGFEYAIAQWHPFVLFEMDSDLSHDPKNLSEFINEIEKGADFVIGSRYMKGGSIPEDWAFHRKLFSRVGNWIIRMGFMKLSIKDWTNGYRAIKTWIIQDSLSNISKYTGYVFQVAILDEAIKREANIIEIPIHFKDRIEGFSKINSTQYISHIFTYIFLHSAFIKFCIVGGIGFVVDLGISYLFIELIHSSIWVGTVISAETAIISNFILNNSWSFAQKKITSGFSLLFNFIKFNVISAGSIVIQAVGLELAVWMFGKTYWPLYKICIIAFIIIPYSYILYTKLIWKK